MLDAILGGLIAFGMLSCLGLALWFLDFGDR
jgi:hypothetical protein